MVDSVRRDRAMASATASRSPLTIVRSDASRATSAPVPTAIPTSASASAGASFTPSPTIATRWPPCRSRRTSATLSSGSTSAMVRSTPTSAPTRSALRRLSPVSRVTVRPWSWNARIAAADEGFTVSATATAASATPSLPTRTTV